MRVSKEPKVTERILGMFNDRVGRLVILYSFRRTLYYNLNINAPMITLHLWWYFGGEHVYQYEVE